MTFTPPGSVAERGTRQLRDAFHQASTWWETSRCYRLVRRLDPAR